MISLKLPKKKEKQLKGIEVDTLNEKYRRYEDEYPYGAKLCFEKEHTSKIPSLKNGKPGDKVKISGMGTLILNDINGRSEIQIEEIEIDSESAEKDAFNSKEM